MNDRIIQSNKEELYASCIKRKMEGWRLAQICAVTINDGFEMSYTFVKDLDMADFFNYANLSLCFFTGK